MSDALDTIRAVGFIAQVQNTDGIWLSWTMYSTEGRGPDEARELARRTVERLLASERYGFTRGRVVRDDWVVEEYVPATTETPGEEAGAGRENLGLEATESERG